METPKEDISLAGLQCDRFGGPSVEAAKEMVYWEDVESDASVISPFYTPDTFMTFEPGTYSVVPILTRVYSVPLVTVTPVLRRCLIFFLSFRWRWMEQYSHVHGDCVSHGTRDGPYPRLAAGAAHVLAGTFRFLSQGILLSRLLSTEQIAKHHTGLDIVTMEEFLKKMAMTGRFGTRTAMYPFLQAIAPIGIGLPWR